MEYIVFHCPFVIYCMTQDPILVYSLTVIGGLSTVLTSAMFAKITTTRSLEESKHGSRRDNESPNQLKTQSPSCKCRQWLVEATFPYTNNIKNCCKIL